MVYNQTASRAALFTLTTIGVTQTKYEVEWQYDTEMSITYDPILTNYDIISYKT